MPNRRRDRPAVNRPSDPPQPWRDLVERASALCRRRLYEARTDGQWYVVALPDLRPDPFVASIMGGAGMQYGLALFCDEGEDAIPHIAATLDSPDPQALNDLYCLGFVLTPYRDLLDSLRDLYRRDGKYPGPHDIVPSFHAKDGDEPRPLEDEEARWMLGAIDATRKTARREYRAIVLAVLLTCGSAEARAGRRTGDCSSWCSSSWVGLLTPPSPPHARPRPTWHLPCTSPGRARVGRPIRRGGSEPPSRPARDGSASGEGGAVSPPPHRRP